MTNVTTRRGQAGERLAEAHLTARGLVTLARNYRCRGGEIDLVMRDGRAIVFVEVRTRASRAFGGAEASVDRRKQARIARCAEGYLQAAAGLADADCRFDVVALHGGGEHYEVNWIRGAFTP